MIDFSEVERRIISKFSVAELEARLKPKEQESKVRAWGDQSQGGFLAPNESLMEIVRADYDTLCSLGKSYEEMAQLAANVLEQVSKKSYPEGNRFTEGIRKLVAKYRRPVTTADRKKITLIRTDSGGFQSCPWGCNGEDGLGYRVWGSGQVYVMEGNGESDLMRKYTQIQREASSKKFPELGFNEAQDARRNILRELEKGIGIEFGGLSRVFYLSAFTVITDLTPHLIASHYFFEGDSSYRTDPRKLLEVVGQE